MTKNNNNAHLSVLDEDWVEKLRQGVFVLTVDAEEAEESFDVNSWDTLLGIPSEDLALDELELEPCGHTLKWKDTLD